MAEVEELEDSQIEEDEGDRTSWTVSEVKQLLSYYVQHKQLLEGKHCTSVTEHKKKIMWTTIIDAISAGGNGRKTMEGAKKKMGDMKRLARAWQDSLKRPKTGGGKGKKKLWYFDIVLDQIIGEKSSTHNGVTGGSESGQRGLFGNQKKLPRNVCCDDIPHGPQDDVTFGDMDKTDTSVTGMNADVLEEKSQDLLLALPVISPRPAKPVKKGAGQATSTATSGAGPSGQATSTATSGAGPSGQASSTATSGAGPSGQASSTATSGAGPSGQANDNSTSASQLRKRKNYARLVEVEVEKLELEVVARKEKQKREECKTQLMQKKLRLTELQCQKAELEIMQLKLSLGLIQPMSLDEYNAQHNTGSEFCS